MKKIITAEVVARELAAGKNRIWAPTSEAVITPGAWTKARELGVTFEGLGERPRPRGADGGVRSGSAGLGTRPGSAEKPRPRPMEEGSAERVRDPSGVTLVRGKSVVLGRFDDAGPDRNIGMLDLIGAQQGAPMAAGIMSFSREDSFPWKLDYDEIDLVLEGKLSIHIDGRTIDAQPGDVVYIPKGSSIVFATPSRVRVFYVTHPANWKK